MPLPEKPRILAVTPVYGASVSDGLLAFLSKQTYRPREWVLIAREPTAKLQRDCLDHDWLHPYLLEGNQSFEEAMLRAAVDCPGEWDFLCQVLGEADGDAGVLESLVDSFREDPCVGVLSARFHSQASGEHGVAAAPPDGTIRMYSRAFFREMYPSSLMEAWDQPSGYRQKCVSFFGWLSPSERAAPSP